ncbi:hypothetical protein OKA06_03865 [Novosphingobium sp. MW5]|nr:hypothetical protein [Novosphingobium sp. MW5]
MATKKPQSSVSLQGRRRRWPPRWLGLLALVPLALLVWFWTPVNGYAQTGASYGARVACSCRYVAGRSLGDCRKDFEEGMGLVMLSEDAAAKSVTARFPLLASQTATYRDGPGCVLEPWDD